MKQRVGVIDAMVLSRYVHDDVPSRRPGLTKVPVLMCPTFLTWNVSNCTLLVCTFARLSTKITTLLLARNQALIGLAAMN
jgi:hypothetical protein